MASFVRRCRGGRDQSESNHHRTSDQYSHAVDERSKSESSHGRGVPNQEKRVEHLESKVSEVIDAETQTCERNIELAVHLAREVTWRSRIIDARARVIAFMDVLGTGV